MVVHMVILVIYLIALIVFVLGTFSLIRMIFLLKGYNVLVPNYTGTVGLTLNNIINFI